MRISRVIKELSRKLDGESGIWKGIDERVKREGILKVISDRRLGESILPVRILERKDKLYECLRTERLERLRS